MVKLPKHLSQDYGDCRDGKDSKKRVFWGRSIIRQQAKKALNTVPDPTWFSGLRKRSISDSISEKSFGCQDRPQKTTNAAVLPDPLSHSISDVGEF